MLPSALVTITASREPSNIAPSFAEAAFASSSRCCSLRTSFIRYMINTPAKRIRAKVAIPRRYSMEVIAVRSEKASAEKYLMPYKVILRVLDRSSLAPTTRLGRAGFNCLSETSISGAANARYAFTSANELLKAEDNFKSL